MSIFYPKHPAAAHIDRLHEENAKLMQLAEAIKTTVVPPVPQTFVPVKQRPEDLRTAAEAIIDLERDAERLP